VGLFKKKSRTDQGVDTQKEARNYASGSFIGPFKAIEIERQFLVDLEKNPRYAQHWDRYREVLRIVADQLPWFGKQPYSPAKEVSREELKSRTLPSIRRILVSFQVGRPMSQIAARVPCSRRTVYEILDELFYRWNSDLRTWVDLGLIAVWDGPKVYFDHMTAPSSEGFWEDSAPIFCLMCHRVVDHVKLVDRLYDSTLVQRNDGRYQVGQRGHPKTQGHMIAHYFLGGRPEPNEPSSSQENLYRMFSGFAGKLNASRWRDRVPVGVVFETQRWAKQPPMPVSKGRMPTRESVIQYYRDLL